MLEIDGAIIGRYRSYEVEQLVKEPEKLEELPGIGERMVEHLQEIVKTSDYTIREKLLKKCPATILDVLQLQSFGFGDSTRPLGLLSVSGSRKTLISFHLCSLNQSVECEAHAELRLAAIEAKPRIELSGSYSANWVRSLRRQISACLTVFRTARQAIRALG